MELCDWGDCSVELASFLVDQASTDLASNWVNNEEGLKSLRHVAGCSWNKQFMGAVSSRKIAAITQRAVMNPRTRELARAFNRGST